MITLIRTLVIILAITVLQGRAAAEGEGRKCASRHEGPVAVFIEPTGEELEKMKREHGEEDFYTIADDVIYYQWEAAKFLEERNIPYCFTKGDEHRFVSKGGREYVMDVKCESWCLILWNGRDEPLRASSVDIFIHDDYLKRAR